MFLMNAPDKFAHLLSLRRDLHFTGPGVTLYIPTAAEAKQAA
jgi:hypothetical protein